MTEFGRDAGLDFPLLLTDLCPDREENLYMQLTSDIQSCITFWKALVLRYPDPQPTGLPQEISQLKGDCRAVGTAFSWGKYKAILDAGP